MPYTPRSMRPVRKKRAKQEILPFYERAPERPLPHKFYLLERRRQATLYRIAGLSNTEIGLMLHADPSVNSKGQSFMGGYGWGKWVKGEPPLTGKGLAQAVSTDLSIHFSRAEESYEEAREQAREIELARLDKAQQAIWNRVQQGNDWAIDRFLGIVDRRMKLMGLEVKQVDVNSRTEITVHHDRIPEVDQGYAVAMLEGLRELSQGTDEGSPDDIIDAEIVD